MIEVRETYVNETKGYQYGSTDWGEAWTDNRGRLFRELQREYGGCVSRMYRDVAVHVFQVPNCPMVARPDVVRWEVEAIGWVFAKRLQYEDARPDYNGRYRESDYYRREVWVEVREVAESEDV